MTVLLTGFIPRLCYGAALGNLPLIMISVVSCAACAPGCWLWQRRWDPSGVGPGVDQVMKGEQQADGTVVFIFTLSAMPAGKELFIGYLSPSQLAVTHGQPGSVERLVPADVPLTCTTQAPPPHYTVNQPG